MKNSNLFSHLVTSAVVTILCGVIYVTVQQSHRAGANDPQLQLARDISNKLKSNQPVNHLMMPDTVEISKSLAVFTVLYGNNGESIQSTGLLDGQLPKIPRGVFEYTKKHGEDVLTWQPRRGVRMATVVESVQSNNIGFVAVGRSLSEVEKRVSGLITMVLLGWLAGTGCILVHFIVTRIRLSSKST